MPQTLQITKVLNGHIVQAGCQTLVFNNPDEFSAEMVAWIRDPEAVEAKYRKMMPCPIPPPPEAMAQTAQEVNCREPRLRAPEPMGAAVESPRALR